MDLAPANKTAILEYMILEAFKKTWNLSTKIRKKVKKILEERVIRINKYSKKALLINGWVAIEKFFVDIKDNEDLKKGVLNYNVKTQKDIDALKKVNPSLKCYFSLTELVEPALVEYARNLYIRPETIDFYSNLTFNLVDCLEFADLSTDLIKNFLKKVKRIRKLVFQRGKLEAINLFSLKVQKIKLSCLTIVGLVVLPKNLKKLSLLHAFNFELVKYFSLTELDIDQDIDLNDNQLKWIKQLSGLKAIILKFDYISNFFPFLPSSLRSISSCCGLTEQIEKTGLESIRKKMPLLFWINAFVGYSAVEKLNLRGISYYMNEDYDEVFSVRPRSIMVSEENSNFLSKHPELFEKGRDVRVFSKTFNKACLPKGLKSKFKVVSVQEKMLASMFV